MQSGADGNRRMRRDLARIGVGPEKSADYVDEKEKKMEVLEKRIEAANAQLRAMEQEESRVRGGLSEEERKRYDAGLSYDAEILDAVKDALKDRAVLEGLRREMPELPLPSSVMAVFGAAEEAKEVMNKMRPELGTLATEIAGVRSGLERLKENVGEEERLREKASGLAKAQVESEKAHSALEHRIQTLEADVQRVEDAMEGVKGKAEAKRLVEERKSSRLLRDLTAEQKRKEVFALATGRVGEFNSRLKRELDWLTGEHEKAEMSLEETTDHNRCLKSQLAVSNSAREILEEELRRKSEELSGSARQLDQAKSLTNQQASLVDDLRGQKRRVDIEWDAARAMVKRLKSDNRAMEVDLTASLKLKDSLEQSEATTLRLETEKRDLESRLDASRLEIGRVEGEKLSAEGELAGYRFGVARLLKTKESLRQDLGESRVANERVEASERTLRDHYVGSQAQLSEVREEKEVLLRDLDVSRSKIRDLEAHGVSLGEHLVASWVKVSELRGRGMAMSASLVESRRRPKGLESSESGLKEQVPRLEAEVAELKDEREASVACFEQFLYEGLGRISAQSWASGYPDLKLVLRDAENLGSVGSQASIWLAAIPGLAEASPGVSAQDRAFHLFIQGHQHHPEVSLDDICGIAEGMKGEKSLKFVLALILGYVRGVSEHAVAEETSFSVARALILVRCVELVYLHVGQDEALEAVRGVFAGMEQMMKSACQESCLVAGLAEWLTRVLKGKRTLSLWRWVVLKARERNESVKAAEADLVRHGDCLIIVKGFEMGMMSMTFSWPSEFRLEMGRGLIFRVGGKVEVVSVEASGPAIDLFDDAFSRMIAKLPTSGMRGRFVDRGE